MWTMHCRSTFSYFWNFVFFVFWQQVECGGELRCRSGIRAAAKWGKRSRFKTFPSFVGFFFFVSFFSFFFSFVSFVSFFFSFAMSLRSGIGTQDCGKLWKQDETYRDLKPLLPLFSRISLFPFLFFLSNTLFLEKRWQILGTLYRYKHYNFWQSQKLDLPIFAGYPFVNMSYFLSSVMPFFVLAYF